MARPLRSLSLSPNHPTVLQPAPPMELPPAQMEGAPYLSWGGRVKHRLATRAGPAPVVELFSASAFVPAGVHERLPPCIYVNDLATREQVLALSPTHSALCPACPGLALSPECSALCRACPGASCQPHSLSAVLGVPEHPLAVSFMDSVL